MTVPATSQAPEKPLNKESRIFRQQLKRLGNCFINQTFDLSVKGSQRRNRVLVFLFIVIGILATMSYYPLAEWRGQLSGLFQSLFNLSQASEAPQKITDSVIFAGRAVFNAHTLRFLPILILPYLIALQSAAMYLADIFELKKIETAREFILQVVFQGSNKSIRIANGDVVEADKNSPIYQIGGPGQVLVELDTAALFEKPNGKPHIIGPTTKGKAKLEGFERFRQAIDLRDQYTDPLDVKSRSFDGIPISTTDVRLVFSVWRENKQPTAESPHPFSQKAIETLVYGQASRVVLDGPHPSESPSSWIGTIQGLIRGELGGFMSKHRLAEYLASIGPPEIQLAKQREEEIIKIGNAVVAEDDSLEPRAVPPLPNFQARHVVSSLFSQFAEGFTKNASNRGVELGWIGVGTWKTPSEIIPEKHLEAWRLSRENIGRGSPAALNGLKQEAQVQRTLRQIKNVPMERYNQNKWKDHKAITQELLLGYREQLIETIELLKKSSRPVPNQLKEAIKHIEIVLGIKHWIGGMGHTSGFEAGIPSERPRPSGPKPGSTTGVPSTPPTSPEEKDLYMDLYTKVGHDIELVERLIEYERKRSPHASRIYLIQRAIDRWLRDNH